MHRAHARVRPLDQALAQPALAPQPPLDPRHPAVVALVIVAEQVQQAVQREHPQLGALVVAGGARLAPRDAAGDHDVAQKAGDLADVRRVAASVGRETDSTSVA